MPTLADTELASTLRISVLRLSRRLRAERSDETLSTTQLSTLASLSRHGPMTLGALAAHERVQPPSMTRVVAALEERELVERRPQEVDRRQVIVAISDGGELVLRNDRRRRDAWLSRRLVDLTREERDLLRAAAPLLDRLAQA